MLDLGSLRTKALLVPPNQPQPTLTMKSLESGLLANIRYYMANDDMDGLASDLSIIINRAVCDDDVEDDVANSLHLNVLELIATD